MNGTFILSLAESILESAGITCDFFLSFAKKEGNRTMSLIGDLIEGFITSSQRTRQGLGDLLKGVAGMIFAPLALAGVLVLIPISVVIGTIGFLTLVALHTASIPIAYLWYLYQTLREAVKPLPPVVPTDYFPEVESFVAPPVLAMSAIALIAGMGIELEPAPQSWSPSFIPEPSEQIELQVDDIQSVEIEAFRWGLEQQFMPKPRQTWKEFILQNLSLPVIPLLEEPLALVYPQCEINPDAQIEIVSEIAVRETVTPFPTPTTSCTDEVECSLPLEVSTALEFPAIPSNKVLQRWDKDQLVVFCDRINAVKKGSITKYKKASKTLLIKKVKAFYDV